VRGKGSRKSTPVAGRRIRRKQTRPDKVAGGKGRGGTAERENLKNPNVRKGT
jgi:hypothetical protein